MRAGGRLGRDPHLSPSGVDRRTPVLCGPGRCEAQTRDRKLRMGRPGLCWPRQPWGMISGRRMVPIPGRDISARWTCPA